MRPRMRTVRSRQGVAGSIRQDPREFWSVSDREEWPWARGKLSLNPRREAPGCAIECEDVIGRVNPRDRHHCRWQCRARKAGTTKIASAIRRSGLVAVRYSKRKPNRPPVSVSSDRRVARTTFERSISSGRGRRSKMSEFMVTMYWRRLPAVADHPRRSALAI